MSKVLFLSYEYPPYGGGAGVVASQFINDLENQEEFDFDKFIIGSKVSKLERAILPLYIKYRSFLKLDLNIYSKIVINDLEMIVFAGMFFSEKDLNKCSIVIHGISYKRYLTDSTLFDFIRGYCSSFKRAIIHAEKIICVSKFIDREFKSDFPVFSDKILASYCGVSKDRFDQDVSNNKLLRAKFNLNLLTVARLIEKKGFDRKLAIFKKLIKVIPGIHWDIVGDGDYSDDFRRIVDHAGLNDNITFHGWVEKSEVSEYYKNTDIFWLLPTEPEAFGLVYIEAQAYGVTCVGSNIGGVSEAINDSTGLVVSIESNERVFDFICKYSPSSETVNNNVEFAKKFNSTYFLQSVLDEI